MRDLEATYGSFAEHLATIVLGELENSGAYVAFYGAANRQFKLSVGTYEVIEDPSDGYRSMLGTIAVAEGDETIFFQTPIAQVRLVKDTSTDSESWSLIDPNGHVWLSYGTRYSDSYYPYFVFDYSPEESQQ